MARIKARLIVTRARSRAGGRPTGLSKSSIQKTKAAKVLYAKRDRSISWDKKYLEGSPIILGGDLIQVDKKGNHTLPTEAEIKKMESQLEYYPRKNSQIEVVPYEQKTGSKQWVEIDRRKYRTDQEGSRIYPKGEHWESDFIDQKLKESNTHSPGR